MGNHYACKADLDSNFIETINLLNENGISYWVCHGTLLGLIRDGGLIPWDHDIDIAIWAGDFPKNSLIELMLKNGFSLKHDGSDYDFVAFIKPGGREVDFNYYRVLTNTDIAISEWFISKSKLASFLSRIANWITYCVSGNWFNGRLIFLRRFIIRFVGFLIRNGYFYKSAGYTTPAALLKDFENMEISGISVRKPLHGEKILEYLYGKDWRIPKPKYDWVNESPATRISDSRF